MTPIPENTVNIVVKLPPELYAKIHEDMAKRHNFERDTGPTRPDWYDWLKSYEGEFVYRDMNHELQFHDFDTSKIAKLIFGRGRSTKGRPRSMPVEFPKLAKARSDEVLHVLHLHYGLPPPKIEGAEVCKGFYDLDPSCKDDVEQAIRNMYIYAGRVAYCVRTALRHNNTKILLDMRRTIPEAFLQDDELKRYWADYLKDHPEYQEPSADDAIASPQEA